MRQPMPYHCIREVDCTHAAQVPCLGPFNRSMSDKAAVKTTPAKPGAAFM